MPVRHVLLHEPMRISVHENNAGQPWWMGRIEFSQFDERGIDEIRKHAPAEFLRRVISEAQKMLAALSPGEHESR